MEIRRYYHFQPQTIPFREYLRLSPTLSGLKAGVAHLMGRHASSCPYPQPLLFPLGLRKQITDLPLQAQTKLKPWAEWACRLGFKETWAFQEENRLLLAPRSLLLLRHASGNAFLRLEWADGLSMKLMTALDDGTCVITSTRRGDLLALPPTARPRLATTRSLVQLWDEHKHFVAEQESTSPLPIGSSSLLRYHNELEERIFRWHLKEGRMRPLQPAEVEALEKHTEALRIGYDQIAGKSDLERHLFQSLHTPPHAIVSTLPQGLMIAIIVTIGALELGLAYDSLYCLGILFSALLLHEAGHWGAHAALRNTSHTAPVQILAGPIPGLLFGLVALSIGLGTSTLFTSVGGLFLTFNLLMLLPFADLNGERLLRCTLYRHHPFWEPLCRGIAAGALISLGATLSSWLILTIGSLVAFTLPPLTEQAWLVHSSRRWFQHGISAEGTLAMARRIRQRLPFLRSSSQIREIAAQCREQITSPAPQWAVSFPALLLYGLALLSPLLPAALYLQHGEMPKRLAEIGEKSPPLPSKVEEAEDR